jgi:hypothetical protein
MFGLNKKKTNPNDLQGQLKDDYSGKEEYKLLKGQTIKELIAPSGIDASNIDHLEIISNVTRYARSFYVSTLPRMATFPELLRDVYMFGDINTSVYIGNTKLLLLFLLCSKQHPHPLQLEELVFQETIPQTIFQFKEGNFLLAQMVTILISARKDSFCHR